MQITKNQLYYNIQLAILQQKNKRIVKKIKAEYLLKKVQYLAYTSLDACK